MLGRVTGLLCRAVQPVKARTAAATLGKRSLKWRPSGGASPSVFFLSIFFFFFLIESFETLHLPGHFPSHLFSGVTIFILEMIVVFLILPLVPHSLVAFLGSAPSLPTAFSLPLLDKLQ